MNFLSLQSLKSFCDPFLGKTLSNATGTFYQKDSELDEIPLDILLVFSEISPRWHITCASDGETLVSSDDLLSAFSMQDDGEIIISSITDNDVINKCIGKKLENIAVLTFNLGMSYIGLELKFSSGYFLYVINMGDELGIYTSLPQFFFEEDEKVTILSI